MSRYDGIGVIGGGLGGLAAVLDQGGYRFDMGPTILTVPAVLERIFAEAGREVEDELDLVELDPQWRCFFEDGGRLDLVADPEQMGANLEEFAPGRGLADRYRRFIELSGRLHRLADEYFFWRPVGSTAGSLSGGPGGWARRLVRRQPSWTVPWAESRFNVSAARPMELAGCCIYNETCGASARQLGVDSHSRQFRGEPLWTCLDAST